VPKNIFSGCKAEAEGLQFEILKAEKRAVNNRLLRGGLREKSAVSTEGASLTINYTMSVNKVRVSLQFHTRGVIISKVS
jgi:hypothetical protein